MDTSYFVAEIKRREELETFALKRFDSVFENRKKESLANVQRYGLEGYIRYLESAPYPLGWEKEWGNLLMQYMREWVGLGYNRSQREIKAELLKSAADPLQKQINSAISYWDSYGLKLSQVEDRDVINRVISQLQFGINQGLPIGDMQALLGQTLDTFKARRLENIARTESGKAYNWGIVTNIYENSDICQYMEVMAVMDKRTTDICIARNGIVIPIKDTSMVAQYTPPFHFQCRTRLVAIVRPSTIKNLPPDKDLIKRATDIEKNIPIFNGFGLSPSDMKIFETNANKLWLLEDLRKPVVKPQTARVSYDADQLAKKLGLDNDKRQYMPDAEDYQFDTGTPVEIQEMVKQKMDEYHQLLGTDRIFGKGIKGEAFTENPTFAQSPNVMAGTTTFPRGSNVFAQAARQGDGDMELYLSRKFKMLDFRDKYGVNSVVRKWSPEYCDTLGSVIDHEMGHAIHGLINRTVAQTAFNEEVKNLFEEFEKPFYDDWDADWNKIEVQKKDYFTNNLSEYSLASMGEMMAEGWSEFVNSPNPRPFARKIGALYKRFIKIILKL